MTTPDVYYVDPDVAGSLVATAPENSEAHKNSQRNHTLSVQKFKFSKIFVPSTSQAELFESTALPLLGLRSLLDFSSFLVSVENRCPPETLVQILDKSLSQIRKLISNDFQKSKTNENQLPGFLN